MRFRLIVILLMLCSGMAVKAQEIVPESDIRLTETLTSGDGTYTINYPEGWYADTNGDTEFSFAITESVLDNEVDDAFKSGDVQIQLLLGPSEEILSNLNVDDSNVIKIMEAFIKEILKNEDFIFDEITATSINDRRTASVTFTMENADAYLALIDWSDDTMVMMLAMSAPDELEQWLPTAVAIAKSLSLAQAVSTNETPLLTEYFEADDVPMTLNYPEGWVAREGLPNNIDVATSEAALDLRFYDEFAPGDVHLIFDYGMNDALLEIDLPQTSDLVEILELTLGTESDDEREVEFTTPESLNINGKNAAFTRALQEESASYFLLIDYDGILLLASVQTAPDELDAGEALLLAMLETVDVE